MSTSLATLICAVGVLGLFYLDRDKDLHTSKALWIPVLWIMINGSRQVSLWLGMSPLTLSASQLLDGSPLDSVIFGILIAVGICALILRGSRVSAVLKKNWPILLFFSYCLLSVTWSDFPGVAMKRWIKAIGDLVIVIIVITDSQPTAALRRLITRTGFILLPASVLVIKYYGDLGHTYDTWTGEQANCGVAVTKNMLGVLTFVLSLGASWLVLRLILDKNQPNRARHFFAEGTLLAFGVSVMSMSHSATAGICFILGIVLMLAMSLQRLRTRPMAVHALVLAILIIGGFAVLFGNETVAHAVGRQSNLTDRTEIWQLVIPMAPNPIVGAGFDSFWLGPRLEKIWSIYPVMHLNESHNGYIETYLNLGWIGVLLIALILISGYRNAVKSLAYEEKFCVGPLLLAYIFSAAFYSITEAGFRQLFLMWIFLLLAVVATAVSASPRANLQSYVNYPITRLDDSSRSTTRVSLRQG